MRVIQGPMIWLMSLMLAILPVIPAQAAMIGTGQLVNPDQSRPAQDKVREFLARDAARKQLQAWGVSQEWARERVARLNDSELARINQAIDQQHAGGTSILGVLVLIFIVFVITDVIGATNIFPFIHPVHR
jgi:hypothetical protein